MVPIPTASCRVGTWRRMTTPASAASTGLTLMKIPKNRAGTERKAVRSIAKVPSGSTRMWTPTPVRLADFVDRPLENTPPSRYG
jgi:hypothetical protein